MSLLPSQLLPGLYTETSDRSALNRYKDGYNIRFFKGNPEKWGGCVKQLALTMWGRCRSIASWKTNSYQRLMAFGTSAKLYLSDNASFFDITPVRKTTDPMATDPFTTTNASGTVAVVDVAHGAAVGDHVTFSGAATVNGIDPNGDQIITVVVDDDNYQFESETLASGAGAGGGAAVVANYDITSGNVDSVVGSGWGAGGWGVGTWGTERVSQFLQIARIWSLPKWGEDLVASPVDGAIYIWSATAGTGTRAAIISAAPAQSRRVLVSDQIRVIISFGSHDGSDPDPMLIRWCDSEDYTDWTPSPTNLAGDNRLQRGSEIITAVQTRGEIAVITDTQLYSMALSGDNNVFNFEPKGSTAGLAGPNAAIDVDGVLYCMGRGLFYLYDGQIKVLPCDVHSRVFGEGQTPAINYQQAAKVYAGRNKIKGEVIWFFPSADATEIDGAVVFNYLNPAWSLLDSQAARTAWQDENVYFDVPIAVAPVSDDDHQNDPIYDKTQLYLQETGVDNDTVAFSYSLKTYDMEVGNGDVVQTIKRLIPDFARVTGDHYVTLRGKKYPNDRRYMVKGPKKVNGTVRYVSLHMRSRQVSIEISSDQIGADMSLAVWRADDGTDGKK